MKTAIYNQNAEKIDEVELNSKIFNIEKINPHVMHQTVVALLAQARSPIASTKTRAEVRGGGKKPWKQKGTGRARVGSIRSPLWRGGGITFGPRPNRNFSKKLNKKTKVLALFSALSDKLKSEKVFIVDSFSLPEKKTKLLAEKLKGFRNHFPALGVKVLIVAGPKTELGLPARNLPDITVRQGDNLNILEILNADSLVIAKDALSVIEKTYLK